MISLNLQRKIFKTKGNQVSNLNANGKKSAERFEFKNAVPWGQALQTLMFGPSVTATPVLQHQNLCRGAVQTLRRSKHVFSKRTVRWAKASEGVKYIWYVWYVKNYCKLLSNFYNQSFHASNSLTSVTLDACTRGAGIWGLQPLGITLFSPRHLGFWTKRELKLLSDYCLSVARCRELHPFYHDPLKLHLCPACAWLCPPLLNVTQPSLWSWQPRCGNVRPISPFLQCKQTPLDVRIMLNRESKVRVGRWYVWYPLCIIYQISMTSWHDHCFGIPTLRVLQRTRITASQLSSTPGCNLERPQKSKRVRKDNFHKGWL